MENQWRDSRGVAHWRADPRSKQSIVQTPESKGKVFRVPGNQQSIVQTPKSTGPVFQALRKVDTAIQLAPGYEGIIPPVLDYKAGPQDDSSAFVTTTRARRSDTREEAKVKAVAALSSAPECPVCQDVHMFSCRRHKGVLFPSLSLSSCKEFRDMGPKDKAAKLEEQSGCSLCTSYIHKRSMCYQTRNRDFAKTCKEMEDNRHPALEPNLGSQKYISIDQRQFLVLF